MLLRTPAGAAVYCSGDVTKAGRTCRSISGTARNARASHQTRRASLRHTRCASTRRRAPCSSIARTKRASSAHERGTHQVCLARACGHQCALEGATQCPYCSSRGLIAACATSLQSRSHELTKRTYLCASTRHLVCHCACGVRDTGRRCSGAESNPRMVVVVMLGGCTYAELTSLRAVAAQQDLKLVVLTTDILTGERLIRSFMPPAVQLASADAAATAAAL